MQFWVVNPKFGIEFHTPDSFLQAKFTHFRFVCTYVDEEFAINGIQPKFRIGLLLTGKYRRGVTERVPLKRILAIGEYNVIQRLCIA